MLPNPYRHMKVVGKWSSYCVTLILPRDEVSWMLPDALELGPQEITPKGTHPVVLYFGNRYGVTPTFPRAFLPEMTYKEQAVGVPFAFAKRELCGGRGRGPFLYLPRLFSSQFLPVLSGFLFWGLAKQLAHIREMTFTQEAEKKTVTSGKSGNYRVFDVGNGGNALVSLDYEIAGEFQPAARAANHEEMLFVMNQPLICSQPLARGPLFSCAEHKKDWNRAEVRPINTVTRIEDPFVPGLMVGTHRSRGLDMSPLGSFQIRAPFELTMPYCCGRGHAPV